jgi:hypothetical protein
MDTTINSTLAAIGEKAPQVAELARAREAAICAERDAEAAILERAVGLIRPALETLCGRIPVASRELAASARPADLAYSQTARGLCLVDGYGKDYSDKDGGQYYGERLYLLSDGTLLETRRQGRWSDTAGAPCEWEVVEERPLSPREAMDEYALAECLEPMWAALDRPAFTKGMLDPIRKTQDRTEKLRAILTLL